MGFARGALRLLESAATHDAAGVAGRIEKAEFLIEKGRRPAAEQTLAPIIEVTPTTPAGWLAQSRAFRLLERPSDACRAATEVLGADPRCGEAWFERARALADLGRYDDALRSTEYAIQLGVDDAWVLSGQLLADLGRPEDALERLTIATTRRPRDFTAWWSKAFVLNRLGRTDEAYQAQRRAYATFGSFGRAVTAGWTPPTPPQSPPAAVRRVFGPVVHDFWQSRRALLIPTLAYIAGLLVWSLNATRNNIGPQVAIDLQYLLAGVIPALIVLVFIALLVVWLGAPAWVLYRIGTRNPRRASSVAFWAVTGSFVVGFAVLGAGLGTASELGLGLPTLALIIVCGAGAFAFYRISSFDIHGVVWKAWGVLGVGAALVLAFLFYSNSIYPRLPQALGGGKPRCAVLDVDPASISAATSDLLAPSRDQAASTVRTVPVDILYSRENTLFVRPRKTDRGKGADVAGSTIELRGDVVRAILAC